jgi:hypothetical protein
VLVPIHLAWTVEGDLFKMISELPASFAAEAGALFRVVALKAGPATSAKTHVLSL